MDVSFNLDDGMHVTTRGLLGARLGLLLILPQLPLLAAYLSSQAAQRVLFVLAGSALYVIAVQLASKWGYPSLNSGRASIAALVAMLFLAPMWALGGFQDEAMLISFSVVPMIVHLAGVGQSLWSVIRGLILAAGSALFLSLGVGLVTVVAGYLGEVVLDLMGAGEGLKSGLGVALLGVAAVAWWVLSQAAVSVIMLPAAR